MGKYSHYSEIDPDFEAIKPETDEAMKLLLTLPVDDFRAVFALPPVRPDDLPMDPKVEDKVFKAQDGTSIPIRVYKAPTVKSAAILFYVMHGGGWTIGDLSTEENMQRYVAGRCEAVVVTVGYRLAPEHRYPQAVDDCFDGLKWCIANASSLGIDPKRIIVGGGSAGGNLAAVMALKARDENVSGIIGQVLNIPVTCHPRFLPKDKYELESWEQNKDASPLGAELMSWFWTQYLGDNIAPEQYHSPLLASSLEGLPPALVQVAGLDPLRDEAIAYADALKAAGVKTKIEVFTGVPHGFGGQVKIKKSKEYFVNVVDFVNSL